MEPAHTPQEILAELTEVQEHIRRLRETRTTLEQNIADLDRQIDHGCEVAAELQEALQKAVAAQTHKAVGG